MRIYHREHAGRPVRIAWALEEAGQPYDVTILTREEGSSDEHLSRHPLGRVPVLETQDGSVFESAAICLQLADLYPQAHLAPEPGTPERGLLYQWTVFAVSELEPPLIDFAFNAGGDAERNAKSRRRFDRAAQAVSDALGEHEFLVGDTFSVADILVGSALGFTVRLGISDQLPANLQAYITRLFSRETFQRAAASAPN